eukprot:s3398_g7.t1
MDQLLQMNEGLTKNLEFLTQRQLELEKKVAAPPAPSQLPHAVLSQPISASLNQPSSTLGALARTLGTPPRTQAPMASGLLASPLVRPPELQELEDEKKQPIPSLSSDPLAQAVLAQSQALTALVSHIA